METVRNESLHTSHFYVCVVFVEFAHEFVDISIY